MTYEVVEVTEKYDAATCNWCSKKLIADKPGASIAVKAGRLGWDWCSGTDSKTFHICHECKKKPTKLAEFIKRIEDAGGSYRK